MDVLIGTVQTLEENLIDIQERQDIRTRKHMEKMVSDKNNRFCTRFFSSNNEFLLLLMVITNSYLENKDVW